MAEFDKMGELPEIVRNLMQSSEIAEIMKSISGAKEEVLPEKPQPAASPLPDDIMEKLPLVMNMLRGEAVNQPQMQTANQSSSSQGMPDMSSITAKLPQVISALSDSGIKPGGEGGMKLPAFIGDKNRKALLKALRPYMSDRKKNAIDTMISMNSMAEIMALLMGGE